jgi:hypothetical protein
MLWRFPSEVVLPEHTRTIGVFLEGLHLDQGKNGNFLSVIKTGDCFEHFGGVV